MADPQDRPDEGAEAMPPVPPVPPGALALGVTLTPLEAGPLPAGPVALTVQKYTVPLTSCVTFSGLALPDTVRTEMPAVQVAV